MIKGKISVKHYLNDKLAARNGNFPLYVLVRFQNKEVRFKSRWKFFDTENIAPLSPLHVVPAYKNQLDYFSEDDLNSKHNQSLFLREANAIIKVGDYFRRFDINFLMSEPSVIFDYSIVPIQDLLSDLYLREFFKSLKPFKDKYSTLLNFLTFTVTSSVDFGVVVRALSQIASKEAKSDFLDKWIKISSQVDLIKKDIRAIDWLTSEAVRHSFIKSNISEDIEKELLGHFSNIPVVFPKKFKIIPS